VAAEILAVAFVLEGKYAANFPFFGQERRGAPVAAFVRFGDEPIRERTRVYHPDTVIVLDRAMVSKAECYAGLKDGGTAILNAKGEMILPSSAGHPGWLATVDATGIALAEIGQPITNSCMLGAFSRTTKVVGLDTLARAMEEFLRGDMLARNRRALQRGFQEVIVKPYERGEASTNQIMENPSKGRISTAIPFQSPYESAWADASRMITVPTGEWRFLAPVVDQKTCRQCGWCSLYCPLGCMKPGEDGYFHPDPIYCKGCGICAYECPAQAIQMVPEEVDRN